MIEITNVETFGWETAIRGMRNPMNSWDKSDSCFDPTEFCKSSCYKTVSTKPEYGFCIGKNDLDLMLKLVKSGSDHAKFRRMLNVTMDILAPLYWWKEFDTYKVGTVANSTSTMHRIHAREFIIDDFSYENLLNFKSNKDEYGIPFVDISVHGENENIHSPEGVLRIIIKMLNLCRDKFIETGNKKYWWQIIQLLPSSYNQLRTIQLNYEVLANIYKSRKDHKLDEWREFCKMIEKLPYSEIITLKDEKGGYLNG